MKMNARARRLLGGALLAAASIGPAAFAQGAADKASAEPARERVARRDGQHDFDFEIGTWHTHLRRLLRPLSGSSEWVEYEGRSVVREIWNGRANLVELEVDGPAGHIEALSLRLYDTRLRQWSLNFSASGSGALGTPSLGRFEEKGGVGEFFNDETFAGRPITVRFVITQTGPDSCRFEQSFSADGGKTWETNWIAVDTRVRAGSG
jgi:hypothetical protein